MLASSKAFSAFCLICTSSCEGCLLIVGSIKGSASSWRIAGVLDNEGAGLADTLCGILGVFPL